MIAIKNLKMMPKSCYECPYGSFKDGIVCALFNNNSFSCTASSGDVVQGTAWSTYWNYRRGDCPLVDMKYELNFHDYEILEDIYEHFCDNVGSYAHHHSVATYHFTEDAGPYTPHSEITIELCDGSTIKYSIPKD